ncbi:hypothetical protein CK203_057924 [Vitis vinifera]|uniref:Uncharacterized protein n=1 Tax=Vitis vinifera TaxID=29760 RepID=A0A438GMR6_VITVI|nr:hypothetical protein CK203_057924 [Vitis vinifera]
MIKGDISSEEEADELIKMFEEPHNQIINNLETFKTRNYYPRPTFPDMQFEERNQYTQASYTSGTIYEWNIDGFNESNEVVKDEDGQDIEDAVATLIYSISKHFIGDPAKIKDKTADLLTNLKCPKLHDFRWIKIREQYNGQIPYDKLTYGEIISIVTGEGIKLCNDFKLKQQMKNEQKIYKNEFGSFCSQFGFSQKETMPPSKQKPSRKPSKDKFYHNNEDDINQLDSSGDVSSQSSSDQDVCIKGNCNCRPKTINVISQDQEFILDTLRKVEDEKTKQNLYEVFKKSVVKVEAKKTVNPYNLNDILNRFDQQSPKDVSIKELHEEVKQHKKEIKELRQFISLGAAENCLQESLVPIPLCEETSDLYLVQMAKDLPLNSSSHFNHHITSPSTSMDIDSSSESLPFGKYETLERKLESVDFHKLRLNTQASFSPLENGEKNPFTPLDLHVHLSAIPGLSVPGLNLIKEMEFDDSKICRNTSEPLLHQHDNKQLCNCNKNFTISRHALLSLQVYSKPFQHKYGSASKQPVFCPLSRKQASGSKVNIATVPFTVHYSLFKHGSTIHEPCGREVGSLFWVFLDYPRIGSSVPGSASPAG